jgi:hypothetical protein
MDEARGGEPRAVKTEVEGTRFQRDFEITLVGFPEALLDLIREDVRSCAYLVPDWCAEVIVEWLDIPADETDGTGVSIATASVNYAYRHASIAIRPIYFSPMTTEAERRANLAHEFVHMLLAPATDYARDRFEDMTDPNSQIRRNLEREWRERVEAVTNDVTAAVGMRRTVLQVVQRPEVSGAPKQRGGSSA